ncbi:hypothetical protein D1007_51652 [Hordeum vulgare]|nr:hypothetical protein D1007_51652 [Hordeum vulgare]
MANFTCNPFAFLPSGFSIEQGPADRKVWIQQNGVYGPANGGNQDDEEPVTPEQQQAPLLFFPPAGQYEEDSHHLSPMAPSRKVARKLWFEDTTPSSDQFEYIPSSVLITELSYDDSESQAIDNPGDFDLTPSTMYEDSHASPSCKRGRRSKSITPLCTSEVRRSPRSNKYMGFKVDLPFDSCGRKSLTKPRASIVISYPAPSTIDEDASSSCAPLPPPTTIKHIQQVGTRLYGIPSEELTDECLLAKGKDDDEQ